MWEIKFIMGWWFSQAPSFGLGGMPGWYNCCAISCKVTAILRRRLTDYGECAGVTWGLIGGGEQYVDDVIQSAGCLGFGGDCRVGEIDPNLKMRLRRDRCRVWICQGSQATC